MKQKCDIFSSDLCKFYQHKGKCSYEKSHNVICRIDKKMVKK